jgi:hypothetical protein
MALAPAPPPRRLLRLGNQQRITAAITLCDEFALRLRDAGAASLPPAWRYVTKGWSAATHNKR